MDKRLTRSDFVFMLVFIFMLVCVVGAFFYGLRLGTERTEAKYAKLSEQKKQVSKELAAYHQSYLVSFYHTIYLPYREFNLKWMDRLDAISSGETDPSAALKELAKIADEKYAAIETQEMPVTSPLLQEGHANYLKSLKLFSKAADRMKSKANSLTPSLVLSDIEKDASFTEAKNFALAAQKDYYDSIVKWNESMNPALKHQDLLQAKTMSLTQWRQLNLNLKNDYIAGIMSHNKLYVSYTPQDLTLRVDEIVRNDKAKQLHASNIQEIVNVLSDTDAVRPGDFIAAKNKWYQNELLPQLPFFSNPE